MDFLGPGPFGKTNGNSGVDEAPAWFWPENRRMRKNGKYLDFGVDGTVAETGTMVNLKLRGMQTGRLC